MSTAAPHRSSLSARPRGVWLMAALELRQRVRSKRWYAAFAVWILVLLGTSGLMLGGAYWTTGGGSSVQWAAHLVFSLVVMLVVFAMLLVLPALSAGAINGDRTAGTLAILQVSLLSPMEIALGKVLAGWITGLAFLGAALPALLPVALVAGVSPFYVLRVLAMIAFLALCIVALGVGLSSFASRQLGSVVLTYLVVLGATFLLPVIVSASSLMLYEERPVTTWSEQWDDGSYEGSADRCVESVETFPVSRSDLVAPLLWVDPMVMVAGMSPVPAGGDPWGEGTSPSDYTDLLQIISIGVAYASNPQHPSLHSTCFDPSVPGYPGDFGSPRGNPVWLVGAAIWGLTALGAVAFTVARLRTPMTRLAAGTRIA